MTKDTESQVLALTDFLLARIAEDEAVPPGFAPSPRVLAECEAKRRIVELRSAANEPDHKFGLSLMDGALRAVALPYADHPDYREEWKP